MNNLGYLRSWRFWLVIVTSTLTLNIGSTAAYFLSDRYFTGSAGEFDPLNVVVAALAGLPIFFLCILAIVTVYRRAGKSEFMPEKQQIIYAMSLAAVTFFVQLPQSYLLIRLILEPLFQIVPGYPFFAVPGLVFILCMLVASFERAEPVTQNEA